MTAPVRLVLATTNRHKAREIAAILSPLGIDVEVPASLPPVVEDGETFLDNALIKARHGRFHAPSDAWVAGEDSGIEVAALDGRPGVESARWAAD